MLIVIFPPMMYIKKTDFSLLQKGVKRKRRPNLETKMLVTRKMKAIVCHNANNYCKL
jgi:hypothetical protein